MFAFTKMHGLGNDFVVFDGFATDLELDADQVSLLCDRHRGIGADGVIIVRPSEVADGFMDYINADGSLAHMCGNGVRVVAKFLVDHGYVEPTGELTVDTRAGIRQLSYTTDHGRLVLATVDMGEPSFEPGTIPVSTVAVDTHGAYPRLDVATPAGQAQLIPASMGNPHAVWLIEDLTALPAQFFHGTPSLESLAVDTLGSFLESHEVFPEKANIEFVIRDENGLRMRVFERGVGETLACGTGACAVLVTASLAGYSPRTNTVTLPGGQLTIEWADNNHVYMTGPATTVYTGHITIPGES